MKIWLINHYASAMFKDKAGRHYWFAKELRRRGYDATVFAASTYFNREIVEITDGRYIERSTEGIPFVFVKTNTSIGNGFERIKSWLTFYKNLFPVARDYARKEGKPDVIIASSVHPLTMVAGIQIARKMRVPCICEVRDLWPEAIFQFGKAREKSLLGKLLIGGEHWIYKNADAIIFTKEGDTDYLKEKKWTTMQGGDINLAKCHYINNGVDIVAYNDRIGTDIYEDKDVNDVSKFNITYAGAIRPVNNVGNLLDAVALLKEGYNDVQFLIFGEGDQLGVLRGRVSKEDLGKVKIKGAVERKYIPYILSKSSVNILNYAQKQYNWTRGNSSNKLFEYMASGKPIISNVHMGYSIIKKYGCGVELDEDTPEALAKEIMRFHDMNADERDKMGQNAKEGAKDFDFKVLTEKLIRVIESVV